MSEFNNRINTQRKTLRIINGSNLYREPLLSLTEKAIHRWVINNHIGTNNKIVGLLREISEALFFLANKSQEQITEEYSKTSGHVDRILDALRKELISKKNLNS